MKIKLKSIEDIEDFIIIVNASKQNIIIKCKSSTIIINAKGILGVASLGLLYPFELDTTFIEENVCTKLHKFEVSDND